MYMHVIKMPVLFSSKGIKISIFSLVLHIPIAIFSRNEESKSVV